MQLCNVYNTIKDTIKVKGEGRKDEHMPILTNNKYRMLYILIKSPAQEGITPPLSSQGLMVYIETVPV